MHLNSGGWGDRTRILIFSGISSTIYTTSAENSKILLICPVGPIFLFKFSIKFRFTPNFPTAEGWEKLWELCLNH